MQYLFIVLGSLVLVGLLSGTTLVALNATPHEEAVPQVVLVDDPASEPGIPADAPHFVFDATEIAEAAARENVQKKQDADILEQSFAILGNTHTPVTSRTLSSMLTLAAASAVPAPAPEPAVAKPPTPQPAPVRAKPAAQPTAWVQLSSQHSMESARKSIEEITRRYAGVVDPSSLEIVKVDYGRNGVYHFVRTPALDMTAANRLCAELRKAGGDCFTGSGDA